MITQIKPVQIVVLAAGIGKRMGIDVPKVLIPLKSKVLINYLLEAIKKSGVDQNPVIVYDYGRIMRDEKGNLIKNVEKRDATSEQLAITEVNPSFYCFDANWLWQNIDKLKSENAQKEYYLTDLVGLACEQGQKISMVDINPAEALGANTLEQLQLLAKLIK